MACNDTMTDRKLADKYSKQFKGASDRLEELITILTNRKVKLEDDAASCSPIDATDTIETLRQQLEESQDHVREQQTDISRLVHDLHEAQRKIERHDDNEYRLRDPVNWAEDSFDKVISHLDDARRANDNDDLQGIEQGIDDALLDLAYLRTCYLPPSSTPPPAIDKALLNQANIVAGDLKSKLDESKAVRQGLSAGLSGFAMENKELKAIGDLRSSDNRELRTENEALKDSEATQREQVDLLKAQVTRLYSQIANLEAEIRRLTAEGDAMQTGSDLEKKRK